jgi:hypothetical protein
VNTPRDWIVVQSRTSASVSVGCQSLPPREKIVTSFEFKLTATSVDGARVTGAAHDGKIAHDGGPG